MALLDGTKASRIAQSSLQATLEGERIRIDSLLEKKKKLLQELSDVDQQLCVANARHGKLRNLRAPVSKLPDELLAHLFQLCQRSQDHRTRAPCEIVVSHVSSQWREVALNTPLLWNDVRLIVPTRAPPHLQERIFQILSVHLSRSAHCLLQIYLVLEVPTIVSRFLYALIPHAQRWHQISISVSKGLHEAILYAPLRSLFTPALVHFSLRVGTEEKPHADTPRTEYPTTCLGILNQGCPKLAFIRMAGMVVGRLAPQYRTVSTLHIDAWPKNIMSDAQFQSMLGALPNVVNLSLTGLSIQLPRDPLVVSTPLMMPTLRSLRIRGNATPCHRLLTFIELPGLEALSLHFVETFDSAPIPTLRSLVLEGCSLTDTEVENIIRAFPSVTSLSIDSSIPSIYKILESDPEMQWPDLEEMYQRELPPEDIALFCLLVLGRLRTKPCPPFRRLFLDKRSRGVLKAKTNYLVTLEKMLQVHKCDHLNGWPTDLGYDDPDDTWRY